jgi:TonB family protein
MLLESLTQAAIGAASVIDSPTADRFADQLVANAAVVALVDAAAAPVPLEPFIAQLHRQFPQLLLLLAGPAALQNQFAAQLADGTIFRLAHKPASAQRLKLFVDAALLRRQSLIDQALGLRSPDVPPARGSGATPRSARLPAQLPGRLLAWLLAGTIVIMIVAAMLALVWRRPPGRSLGSAPPADAARATPTDTPPASTAPSAAGSANSSGASTPVAAAVPSDEEAERDAIDRAAAERAARDRLSVPEPIKRSADDGHPTSQRASSAPTAPAVVPESTLQQTYFVPPVYPPQALAAGVSGSVDLEFTVTPEGVVRDIEVKASEPHGVFEQAAVDSVSHSRYRPVERDGVAIAQRARIRLQFQP